MPSVPSIERLEPRSLLSSADPTTTGVRDLLYVRVRFSDQVAEPESAEQSAEVTTAAVGMLRAFSGGQLDVTVRIETVTLNGSERSYRRPSRLASRTDRELRRAGVDLASFEHLSYRYDNAFVDFDGLGDVGGRRTWVTITNAGALAHELGHNLGLRHSQLAVPKRPESPFGRFSKDEYGDVFSNMGESDRGHWNAHQKHALGWLADAQVATVDARRPASFTVSLAAHDLTAPPPDPAAPSPDVPVPAYDPAATYLLRVRTSSKSAYYVSYRADGDLVLIHRDAFKRPVGGYLIDAAGGTPTPSDANVPVGGQAVDPRGRRPADDITFAVTRDGPRVSVTITIGIGGAPAAA